MSIQAVGWVLEHSSSRGTCRLVLIALANHANGDGECWPAMRRIAAEAGCGKSAVSTSVQSLVELGELVVLEAGGPRRSARYRLAWIPGENPVDNAGYVRLADKQLCPPGGRSVRQLQDAASAPGADRIITEPSMNHHAGARDPDRATLRAADEADPDWRPPDAELAAGRAVAPDALARARAAAGVGRGAKR